MSKPLLVPSVWILVGLLAGCAHVQNRPPEGYTLDTFWRGQATRAKMGHSFFGKLNLQLSSRDSSARGLGQIVTQSGRLRLEVRDPLGRMQLLVTSSGKAFTAYYPKQKTAYQDRARGKFYLSRILDLPLDFVQLQALLMGNIEPLLKERFKKWKWNGKRGVYVAGAQTYAGRAQLEIDPKHNLLTRIELPSRSLEVNYSNHRICCQSLAKGALRLSHQIEVENKKSKSGLGVTWRSFAKAPEGVPNRAFKPALPAGVSPVLLK